MPGKTVRRSFQDTVQNASNKLIPGEVNESSPLLHQESRNVCHISGAELTPEGPGMAVQEKFPMTQLYVLGLVRIIEPITFTSVLPYIYAQTVHLLSSNTLTEGESSIALYSAILMSSFAFSETLTSHLWGSLSDTYGRKPVIILGLTGTAISLILYGFSTSIVPAMIARVIGGLLNGNIGVLQTAVMELTGAREDWRTKGQLILPFVWCLGSIIGPAIGGGLSPNTRCDKDMMCASALPSTSLLERYPYALPNIVCALIAVFGIVVGWLWMEETNQQVKGSKPALDSGLVVGGYLLGGLKKLSSQVMKLCDYTCHKSTVANLQLEAPKPSRKAFKGVPEPPGTASCSETTAITTANPSSSAPMYQSLSVIDSCTSLPLEVKDTAQRSTCTLRFCLLMVTFFILYYHTTAYEHLLAIFLQSHLPPLFPTSQDKMSHKNSFGFTTRTMGYLFLIQGIFQMSIQFIAFPYVNKRFSTMGIYVTTLAIYPIFYFLMPLLVLIPPNSVAFWICLSVLLPVKVAVEITCYPALFMVIYDFAVDSPSGMGGVYGLSAAVAGAAQSVGPVVTGAVWKAGMSWGGAVLAWWMLSALSVVGVGIAAHLKVSRKGKGKRDEEE